MLLGLETTLVFRLSNPVAAVRQLLQGGAIHYRDQAALPADKITVFQLTQCNRHARTLHAQHHRQKLMGKRDVRQG